jgi:hypothetical protein
MSTRCGSVWTAIATAVVAVVLLLGHPALSPGQMTTNSRQNCRPVGDAAIQETAAQTPSLTHFPVVVHYMKHRIEGSGPDSAVSRVFPLDKLKSFFAENGDFNRAWWTKHRKVMFVLVGVETCTYTLEGGDRIPVADTRVMRKLNKAFNVDHVVLANGRQPFKGLDLYLWAGIEGQGGVQVAGFARSAAAMPRPSIWMAADCEQRGGSVCASKFGHEVGHFFGLCHLCVLDAVSKAETNPNTCRQTCPPAGRAGTHLPVCTDADGARLMADQDGMNLEPCELTFAVSNATKIVTPAVH